MRQPGQYFDAESALSYNYFRDYDSATGRYVESDPIGLGGGKNTYAYVRDNPLRWRDVFGLKVMLCHRPADLPWPLSETNHYWLQTSTTEAGMGNMRGGVPAQNSEYDLPGDPTQTTNHHGESQQPNATCVEVPNQDELCVNQLIQPGQPTGPFSPSNNCQTFTSGVLNQCHVPNRNGPFGPPDISQCQACINALGGENGLCQIACATH